MTINLYFNKSSPNYFKKELTALKSLNVNLKENCSVFNPTLILTLDEDLLGANYVYIPKFKRYYNIMPSKIIMDGRQEISLKCDVLMSFPNTIKSSNFVFERTSNNFNSYLPDNDKISSKHYIANMQFDSTPFTTSLYVGDDPESAKLAHYIMILVNDGNTTPATTGGEN